MAEDVRIGIVGTGFVSRHFALTVPHHPGYRIGAVLTRRDPTTCVHPAGDLVTRDLAAVLDASDVLLECSGDPLHATDVVEEAVARGLPVVTMNAEFHVTAGSYFVGRGLVTEAEGDQPGCEAALAEEARTLGFRPLVYGNMKGFLNLDPTPEEMEYWGARQGISLPMVTSFTDGTKVQIEQALVANGLGATVAAPGMVGLAEDDLGSASAELGRRARDLGRPIAEYVLSRSLPHGVFIVAEHDAAQAPALEYLKLGPGPYYTLVRNNIFVHLEIMKTIRRVVEEGRGLLDNSAHPEISVVAVAKRDLAPGTRIAQGIGSFDVRGEARRIREVPDHVPIGLLQDATIVRSVERGAVLTVADVELPERLAVAAWRRILTDLEVGEER